MNYSENLQTTQADQDIAKKGFLSAVYAWMGFALAITAVVAYFTSTSYTLLSMIYSSNFTFYGLIIGELVLVGVLSARIRKMSVSTAMIMFIVYSAVNGLTLSSIFVVYAGSSIALIFGISALMFGGMSVVGMITKKNLNRAGHYLYMALIGVIIASIINIFLKSDGLTWILSMATVVIFTGLTAYDTQKIMQLSNMAEGNDTYKKVAIIGALHLYLDFINIFLSLLRLFGRRN